MVDGKISIGRIIGNVLEGLWTIVKVAVIVAIVTALVGFFLTRNLMIRGRVTARETTQNMQVSATSLSTKSAEVKKAKDFIRMAKTQKITLTTDDGSILVANKIIVSPEGDNWAVILHGYNGNMEDVEDIAMHYAEQGFNVLTPDLRAHGESETSFRGMGWLDRMDVINWIDVILEECPTAHVVIHGVDVGAATALMVAGEPLKSSIKAIVAEGAYTTAWDIMKPEMKAKYPKFPTFPCLNMMSAVVKVWGGYSLKEASALSQVKNAKIPILYIQGANDTYTPPAMSEKLSSATASTNEVFTIASGTHEDCRFAEPETYYNKTFDFVNQYVK